MTPIYVGPTHPHAQLVAQLNSFKSTWRHIPWHWVGAILGAGLGAVQGYRLDISVAQALGETSKMWMAMGIGAVIFGGFLLGASVYISDCAYLKCEKSLIDTMDRLRADDPLLNHIFDQIESRFDNATHAWINHCREVLQSYKNLTTTHVGVERCSGSHKSQHCATKSVVI